MRLLTSINKFLVNINLKNKKKGTPTMAQQQQQKMLKFVTISDKPHICHNMYQIAWNQVVFLFSSSFQ